MVLILIYFFWVLKGLDFVVSEAGRYGIKLILSLVNNYENFGGRKQYVDWARSQGQNVASDDDFFTNSVIKGYYKNHIKVCPPSLSFYYNFFIYGPQTQLCLKWSCIFKLCT